MASPRAEVTVSDHQATVLGAAEGVGADIAWVVIYVLCWILMVAPFALWWAGVRTPRAERQARRAAAADGVEPARIDDPVADDEPARVAG
jgi:hypothetical protein